MKKRYLRQLIFAIILVTLLLIGMPAYAAPLSQEGNPCALCSQGR